MREPEPLVQHERFHFSRFHKDHNLPRIHLGSNFDVESQWIIDRASVSLGFSNYNLVESGSVLT